MRKKHVWMKRVITGLLSTALTISAFSFATKPVQAGLGYWPNDLAVPNGWYYENRTLQPYGTCLQIGELLNWSPDTDPDARYNRSSIPLRKRWMGPSVNPKASRDAKLYPLITSNARASEGPSQGGDGSFVYAFNNFQYVDTYNFWGGSSGEGPIAIPSPEHIDSAHRNGAYATGTIFLPWGDDEFGSHFVREMVKKNPDGSYPAGDKLIEIAQYYGFDGYIFNAESGTGVEGFQDFLKYLQQKGPENFRIAWYNGSGTLVPSSITHWMQDGDARVTDDWWLDMSGRGNLDGTIKNIYDANRSPWEVHSTWEYIPMAPGAKGGDYQDRLDENGFLKSSLGVLFYATSLTQSKDIDDFINVQDPKVWVGPTFNPASTERPVNEFCGFANMIADRTPLLGTDFTTHFIAGNGYKFYENGKVTGKEETGWYNRSLTDVLPTWRWIIDAEEGAKKLSAKVDYSDAYFGGSSIRLYGDLDAGKSNHVKLYSSHLNMTDHTKADIVYKTPDAKDVKLSLGLCFGDDYSDKNFKFYPLTVNGNGEWNKATVDLSGENGKTAIAISLKAESPAGVTNYSLNLGKLSVYTEQNAPKATSKITIDDILFRSDKKAEVRLYWEKAEGAFTYIIHRLHLDGREEFVGATPSTAYYLLPMTKDGDERTLSLRITSVSENGVYGGSREISIDWPPAVENGFQEAHALGTNWALNAPAYSSVYTAADGPVDKLDDGVIPSSKWCGLSTSGSAYIDLGQNREISRWIVYHANCRGAGEGKNFNTVDFNLEYAPDDGKPRLKTGDETRGEEIAAMKFTVADKVTNNTQDVTDRNIKPIEARYIRLNVLVSDSSPWRAIRIYELELYSNPGTVSITAPSTPLNRNVSVVNNPGATDEVIIDNVGRSYSSGGYPNGTLNPTSGVVKLYSSAESKEALATATAETTTPIQKQLAIGTVSFKNLNLNPAGGRLWYTLSEDGVEGLRYSFEYLPETGTKPAVTTASILRTAEGSEKNMANDYGMLTVTGLGKGARVAVYANDTDVKVMKYSYPAQADGKVSVRYLPLTKTGGNLYYEVHESGKPASDRFVVSYGNTADMNAEVSALSRIVNLYEGYQKDAYTEASWTEFENARAALRAKIASPTLKGSEIDTLRDQFYAAEAKLFLKGDTARLREYVKEAEGKYEEAGFTPKSFKAYKEVLDKTKSMLDAPDIATKTNQDLVNARVALDKSIRALELRYRYTEENVPDEALRNAIIEQTGSPYIADGRDYEGGLDLSKVKVTNFKGLELLPKLKILDLSNQEIENLPAEIPASVETLKLENCTKITVLNQRDLKKALPNLKHLDLKGCSGLINADLSGLGLVTLDVSGLSAYPNLFRLDISNNKLDLLEGTPEGTLVRQFEEHLKTAGLKPQEGERGKLSEGAVASGSTRPGSYDDPSLINDNELWTAFFLPVNGWAALDLGSSAMVDEIKVESSASYFASGHFEILYATEEDKDNWQPLTSYKGEKQETVTLAINPAKKLRYVKYVDKSGEETELAEFEIYGKKITEPGVFYKNQNPDPVFDKTQLKDKSTELLQGSKLNIVEFAKKDLVLPFETARGNAFTSLQGKTWLAEGFDVQKKTEHTLTVQNPAGEAVPEDGMIAEGGDYTALLKQEENTLGSFTVHVNLVASPGIVKNLTAVTTTSGIRLSWDKAENAEGYLIYRRLPGEKEMKYLYMKTTTTYVDQTDVDGMCFYRVYAFRKVNGKNALGTSDNYAFAAPLPKLCGVIKDFTVTLKTEKSAILRWTAAQGAAGYVIYRQAPGEKSMTPYKTVTGTEFTDTLEKPGMYYYRVAPFSKNTFHTRHNVATDYKVVTAPEIIPAPVRDLSFTRNGSYVNLKWSKTDRAEFYLVYRQAPGEKKMTYLYLTKNIRFNDKIEKKGYHFYTVYACRKMNGKNVVSPMGNYVYTMGR